MIFLDTSAIYALADRADANHGRAKARFAGLIRADETFLTHSYVLVEAMVLIQHRLGLAATLAFARDAEAFEVEWVDGRLHKEAVAQLIAHGRRRVSVVDEVSFLVMRTRGVRTAFAFDRDFAAEGFDVVG